MTMSNPLMHGSSQSEWEMAHQALKEDKQLWPCLGFAGIQPDDKGQFYEARHCPCCQSTINRTISREEALGLLLFQAALVDRSRALVVSAPAHKGSKPRRRRPA